MQMNPLHYRIETNSINGGLLKRPAKVPPTESGTNAFVCSVQVENFDKTNEQILQNGGQVALPKFAIPGRCWQGYFVDLDNNTFGIFEFDENANKANNKQRTFNTVAWQVLYGGTCNKMRKLLKHT